jgi:hypothetical protein
MFFRWTAQHFAHQGFFGTSENAVKSQIWIAGSSARSSRSSKRLNLSRSLYEIPRF